MNVLIVSQYFWPENFRINDLAISLEKRGHVVTVLTGIPNYPEGNFYKGYRFLNKREEIYGNLRVMRAPLISRGNGGAVRLFLNYVSFAISASFVSLFRKCDRQDVIIVFEPSPITVGIPAIVGKIRHRAPILFWVQDLWPETLEAVGAIKSKMILNIVDKLVRFIYKHCDMILVQSQAFISSVQQHCSQTARIEYFPNSAEEYYRPVVLEDGAVEKAMLPNGFVVMFAGNIGVAQDFPVILDAAELTRDVPDIKWVVIGDGRQRDWVAGEITRRNLDNSVCLLGKYPAERMPNFFSRADALLVTLKRDPTFSLTIPSKVQSYMACARPIIAALDGEGARAIEEAGAGIVCPAESPRDLADAVISMYNMSSEERVAMGQQGRHYYEKEFGRTMLVDRLECWMKDLVMEKQLK